MEKRKRNSRRSVQGIIIPAKRDDHGKILSVAIHTDTKNEYLVEQSWIGLELNAYIYQRILAEGSFRERLDGKTLIRVKKYQRV
jgi:hypothetical protein